ncbi:Hemimethylated DNA-binding protein YccV like-domain-containing protein [Mycena galericulata]|nr:Hemimethylated DNA-binding protein YccV like-domain-containing protein [Mycena galericulata]
MPQLPLDLYISVLEQLPVHRTDCDGVLALVNCLGTNTILREAALVPTLWEPHYRARYLHCEKLHESKRREDLNGNWRLMYVARRRQDGLALQHLKEMVSKREGRYQHASAITSLSFDVWDALEIECSLPVPPIFSANSQATYIDLTRRFWASSVLGTISKRFALLQWGSLATNHENPASFVDAFSSLSCFFGKSPQEIHIHLTALAVACHEYLLKMRCPLNPELPEYDLPGICANICQFMHEQGFGAVEPAQFHDISNHFPHIYLTTNKRSIPISLVHIFVSLARHLGIQASPVEFPMRVLAHIPSPPGTDDFLVDVYGADTKPIVSLRNDIPTMLMRLGISPDSLHQYVSPCGAAPMLLRAARNILTSFRSDASRATAQAAIYAAICIHLLFMNDVQLVTHMLSHVDLDPLYCATFLSDLQPFLRGGGQRLLEEYCRNAMEIEEQQAAVVHPRTAQIAHYVGMVFEHRAYAYQGCIIGWEPICSATLQWQTNMNVHILPRGANQPFYHVFSLDGTQRYVAEDNISPVALTGELAEQFMDAIPVLPKYFSNAILDPESGRGRWRLSPELRRAYPDDEQASQFYDEFSGL